MARGLNNSCPRVLRISRRLLSRVKLKICEINRKYIPLGSYFSEQKIRVNGVFRLCLMRLEFFMADELNGP